MIKGSDEASKSDKGVDLYCTIRKGPTEREMKTASLGFIVQTPSAIMDGSRRSLFCFLICQKSFTHDFMGAGRVNPVTKFYQLGEKRLKLFFLVIF